MKNSSILPTKTGEMLITQKCNLNCKYCFEKKKSFNDIDFDKAISLLTKDGKFIDFAIENFYIFGGEPFMNLDFIEKLVHYIDDEMLISSKKKSQYKKSIFGNLITNGTLLDKHIDFLRRYKDYGITLQVSVDGPEYIHDENRVDFNNRGSFKKIIDNLSLLRDEGIPYSLHGVVSKSTYSKLFEITKFFIEEYMKMTDFSNTQSVEGLIGLLNRNYLQIVFEDETSDDDINMLLNQFYDIVEYVLESKDLDCLNYDQRKRMAIGFLTKHGGICSAGTTMLVYDDSFNTLACHRFNTSMTKEELEKKSLMPLLDTVDHVNYNQYIQYQEVFRNRIIYGANISYDGNNMHHWANWCPGTNLEVTGSVSYMSSKHNVLMAELNNYIPQLAKYFELEI